MKTINRVLSELNCESVIIHVPERIQAEKLVSLLSAMGANWGTWRGDRNVWGRYGEDTAYRVSRGGIINYGDIEIYEDIYFAECPKFYFPEFEEFVLNDKDEKISPECLINFMEI